MLQRTLSGFFFAFFCASLLVFPILSPVILLSLANKFTGLPVHDTGASPSLLPGVVVPYQSGDQLIWQLKNIFFLNYINITELWGILITLHIQLLTGLVIYSSDLKCPLNQNQR